MSDTAVMEPVTETPIATPKRQMTDEQKQAATFRRDAALLRKYGDVKKAEELEAQADQIAPAGKQTKRVDPLTAISQEDQTKLRNYLRTAPGFARLAQVVSAKKLQEIVGEIGS